jgi:hypothetical protein
LFIQILLCPNDVVDTDNADVGNGALLVSPAVHMNNLVCDLTL